MARYDVAPAWFRTPRGKSCLVYLREGTNDWNTANAVMGTNDEYETAGITVDGTFVDIGGHIGSVTLAVLLDNPQARAVVVEPLPENLDLIRRNLFANGLLNRATIVAGAVGSGPVTITYAFRDNENDLHHAYIGNANTVPNDGREHSTITYQGLSFAEIAPEGAQVAKIDCEGGEWAALPGMTGVPLIVGEYHPTVLPDGSIGSRERVVAILGATHDVTFPNGEAWDFRAVRR